MRTFIAILIALELLLYPLLGITQSAVDLNNQIQTKQQQLTELKKQLEAYQSAIAQKQLDANTLTKQLSVLDDKVAQAELGLQTNQLTLDTTALQVQAVTADIAIRDQALTQKRGQVAELLRQLYRADQQSLLEVVVLNTTLGQFFEQLNYLTSLEHTVQTRVTELQQIKVELERRQEDLASYQAQLVASREQLEQSRATLATEQATKQDLLSQTKQSERRYQSLLAQAQAEQEQANRDIQTLEQQARVKLNRLGPSALDQLNDTNFIWPVAPRRGIATYFHDPTYIFRRYFEHPGIDIPTPQGTSIAAAASGYVARAKDAGLGYSYIMLVHKDGFATVYGHVSRIDVSEGDFVTKGQTIGGSGGTPGTHGAGPLTTGPHLHFEVRVNGIPVDPLDYLP